MLQEKQFWLISQLNGGQTLLSLIVSVSSAFFVDRFGRRPLFLVSTVGMFFVRSALQSSCADFHRYGPHVLGMDRHLFCI